MTPLTVPPSLTGDSTKYVPVARPLQRDGRGKPSRGNLQTQPKEKNDGL